MDECIHCGTRLYESTERGRPIDSSGSVLCDWNDSLFHPYHHAPEETR